MEGAAEHGRVHVIISQLDYAQQLLHATQANKLVVVDYSARWCGPCNFIAPQFAELSQKYQNVEFLKIDVDDQKELATLAGISALPTFVFIRDGATIDQVAGANISKVEAQIKKHLATNQPQDENDPLKFPPGHMDLHQYIDKQHAACLNENKDHPWQNVLTTTSDYLESDCDEQLLLYIPFNQAVKLHSINVEAKSDETAPKSVKLYVNNPHMDFQSVDSTTATQELELGASDVRPDSLVPVKFVKFQNMNSITIFVESNQGGADTTIIQRIRFIGQPKDASDMSQFKRVAGDKNEVHG